MDGTQPSSLSEPPLRAARRVRRAAAVATGTSLFFLMLFVVTAQVPAVRAVSPWSDDPSDAILSFVALVLPVVIAVTGIRAFRWRGPRPAPPGALRQLLRGATAAASLVGAGVLACLATLLTPSGMDALSGMPATVGWLLVATTLAACLALAVIGWTWATSRPMLRLESGVVPDLFDDVGALATRIEADPRIAPAIRGLMGAGRRASQRMARPVRAHPWRACALIAVVFGGSLSLWHSAVEGVPSLAAALVIVPVYAALGALLVVVAYASVGRYLELIRGDRA